MPKSVLYNHERDKDRIRERERERIFPGGKEELIKKRGTGPCIYSQKLVHEQANISNTTTTHLHLFAK